MAGKANREDTGVRWPEETLSSGEQEQMVEAEARPGRVMNMRWVLTWKRVEPEGAKLPAEAGMKGNDGNLEKNNEPQKDIDGTSLKNGGLVKNDEDMPQQM